MNWNKKQISPDEVRTLQNNYGIDALTASIFLRRGITKPNEILYFLENDLRYLHNPFLFEAMEDAVDLIEDTIEEGGKILIFGDSDVDGVTSTAILFTYLKKIGADVEWRLPLADDAYGLSMQAVDDFAGKYGSLIITVDCGISNNIEVAHAAELGLNVIITDHHNPPENLPEPAIIIDPKLEDSGYPFEGISGAAVAFKLATALRFSKSDFYKQEICLLAVSEESENDKRTVIQCRKLRNLLKRDELFIEIDDKISSIADTKLPYFLAGQQIFVWDAAKVKKQLGEIFGSGVEFNLIDLKGVCSKFIPGVSEKSISDIKNMSRVLKYLSREAKDIDALTTMFVTYARQEQKLSFPEEEKDVRLDLELVAMAALADIMPMIDENRILVRNGVAAINNGEVRQGIRELFANISFQTGNITASDLSWNVIPCLNAAGRMGQADVALKLLVSEDAKERETLAAKIVEMNETRKTLVNEAVTFTAHAAEESLSKYGNNLCVVIDGRIHHGVTGLVASRLLGKYNIPAMAVTLDGETATGSMRSCRNFNSTEFLGNFGDLFINYGGHNYASGFSFKQNRMDEFLEKLNSLYQSIVLSDESDDIDIDAELPNQYLTPDILKTVDLFEPFGEENRELIFMSRQLPIMIANVIGKSEPRHLKLTMDCGKHKFPALFWKAAEKLGRDFNVGDKVNLLYKIEKNNFNGTVTAQMVVRELTIN